MTTDQRQPKPRGFGLFSRIVYIHQAICIASFLAGLRLCSARGIDQLILPHLIGIVLSIAVLIAMFGVATRKSSQALTWLRLILWASVVKILFVPLWLLLQGHTELSQYIRALLLNALVAFPVAVYWTRPVHQRYLASLGSAQP